MLRPVQMSKVRLVCIKSVVPSLIRFLHNMSVVHIKEAQLEGFDRAGPMPSFEEVSSRHLKIKALLDSIGRSRRHQKKKIKIVDSIKEADEIIASSDAYFELLKQKEAILKELENCLAMQKSVSEFLELDIDFSSLSSGLLQFLILKSTPEKIKHVEKLLSKRKNISFISREKLLLIALPKEEDYKFIEKYGTVVPIPKISLKPSQELSRLKSEEAALRERLAAVDKKINKFIEANYHHIVALEEDLAIQSERARISTLFRASSAIYYIEGWIEKQKLKVLQQAIKENFGKKVHISEAPIDEHHEIPPTKLSNPKPASPFQFLVDFLSTTNYREIDPSLILFLTIPILYALILGDAGYALVSFFLARFMVKKSKQGSLLNQIAKIWMISAIPAFIAGLAFDEYFGFTHTHIFELLGFGHMVLYHGLHRVSSITQLMLICIIVGMVHLGLGFILGAINEWGHSKKHAIAKLCWLGVEISGFFLVASGMFGVFSELMIPSGALFLLSVAVMILTEGAIAALEIPGLASNIMSYIRIAAVGVGGVILAEAINELLLPRLDFSITGVIFFIITLALYLIAHLFACVLAMFESFVHGARLNVVEFFGKFYKGNGIRFSPFAVRRIYSQEAES
ncbi:MAG: V-type ATPase 116kDa subunit family protein [Candidatus Anstonellaceae archaeon]